MSIFITPKLSSFRLFNLSTPCSETTTCFLSHLFVFPRILYKKNKKRIYWFGGLSSFTHLGLYFLPLYGNTMVCFISQLLIDIWAVPNWGCYKYTHPVQPCITCMNIYFLFSGLKAQELYDRSYVLYVKLLGNFQIAL